MDEAYKETEELLEKMERRVRDEYRKAAADMQRKLIEYQQAFYKKNKKKLEQLRDGKITAKEYSDWYRGQVLIGQRWIDMRDTLAQDMTHSNEIAASIINGYIPEAYAINHNYGTFQIEKQSLIDTSYSLYSRESVERLFRNNPDLLPAPRVDIPKDLRYNKQIIQSAAIQGILQGESVDKIAKRLKPEMAAKQKAEDVAKYTSEQLERKLNIAAVRNARTMMTSAQNGGRMDAYRRAREYDIVSTKIWLATPDARVRDSHARLDGEEQLLDEPFSNGLDFPGDESGAPAEVYNCRCSMNTRVKYARAIDYTDFSTRFSGLARDYVNGEDMTYQDWKDLHSTNPVIKKEAQAKWEVSERGKQRKQRHYS